MPLLITIMDDLLSIYNIIRQIQMFWMLQECLNFLTLNSFVRFWGFSRRQREFDLEDEFVPVVGKRNQLRASDTLSTVAFETPSFEVQCFELNGTAPNGHVDVSGSGSSSFRSSSKATAAAVIPSRLTIAPKTTGGSMGARVERANGGGGPAPTIMVESMSMHSVDEIANSVSDCSSAHQDVIIN